MSGRPRFLDDAKCREICALISVGCRYDLAAMYVGCSVVTIRRESVRNPDFKQKLREAQVAARVGPLRALRNAAQTHWRAAAWLLERNFPQEFARRSAYSVNIADFKDQLNKIVGIIQDEIGGDASVYERIDARLTWLMNEIHQEMEADSHALERKPKKKLQRRNSRPVQAPRLTTPPARPRPEETRNLNGHEQNSPPFCSQASEKNA